MTRIINFHIYFYITFCIITHVWINKYALESSFCLVCKFTIPCFFIHWFGNSRIFRNCRWKITHFFGHFKSYIFACSDFLTIFIQNIQPYKKNDPDYYQSNNFENKDNRCATIWGILNVYLCLQVIEGIVEPLPGYCSFHCGIYFLAGVRDGKIDSSCVFVLYNFIISFKSRITLDVLAFHINRKTILQLFLLPLINNQFVDYMFELVILDSQTSQGRHFYYQFTIDNGSLCDLFEIIKFPAFVIGCI